MALEGPLKEFHIQDVFQLLDLGRKSGVLRVTSELRQTAGTVSFERGGVVAATLGRDPQPIGARLVRMGKISADDLQRAYRRPRSNGGGFLMAAACPRAGLAFPPRPLTQTSRAGKQRDSSPSGA